MPQCKVDGCRLEAQKHGKQLCPAHEAERKARDAAYYSKPQCMSCKTRRTNNIGPDGNPECPSCRNDRYEREEIQESADFMTFELDRCETVEELKEFIKNHLMGA
jgi:hypothetical protein